MNDFEPVKQAQDNTEQVIKFPKSKQHLGSLSKPHRGMELFEIDLRDAKNLKATKAKYEFATLPVKEETLNPLPRPARKIAKASKLIIESTNIHKRLVVKDDCWYVWAINEKNAIKQFIRLASKQ